MNHEPQLRELERIIENLKAGEPTAREQLIQISWDRLRRLAKKMLGGFPNVRRWEETDDVFQRSTVRLWEALKVVQPENARHFLNLAALQVRRELIELSRSLNGVQGLNNNQDSVAEGNPVEPANSNGPHRPETWDSAKLAAWTEFHHSVDQLDEQDREVFQLIWYQGLGQKTVSELLGVSQKTVSRRWQTSRRKVYELLDGNLPE